MIIYENTEKEITNYIPVPKVINDKSVENLRPLYYNLLKAIDNCLTYGSDFLATAIYNDMKRVERMLNKSYYYERREYKTRYYAEKDRIKGEEIIVKVEGGYKIFSYGDYNIWIKQK